MDNKNQQPVMPPKNDFLSRMDMAGMPVQPVEPEKKGLSKGVIIGIVIGVVALIGVIVGVIIVLNSGKSEPTPTVTATYPDEPEEPEVDEEMEARNALRANDLLPVKNAVNAYQATPEADGQLPGPEVVNWTAMLNRFVPSGVIDSADGGIYTVGAVCKFGESCVDISSLTWEVNKHQIFALYNADCKGKTKENVIVSSTRKRRVAIFAIIEGDEFICTTNGE